ncbi:MAG TPA: FGGY family carbohydrate kinase [Chloroflexota bacterium]|nr:FGGY family carbohydrate kinase [Chloroflexota bacterium]
MAEGPLLLGIDLGTTTCRAIAFTLGGEVVVAAAHETPIDHPRPDWAEVPPERWWNGVAQAVRSVTAEVGAERIAAVGATGLMHAPVLLDERGEPVAPTMLWFDQRCRRQREALAGEIEAGGKPARIGTTHAAPRLRWLAAEQAKAFARVRALLLPKDFVRFKLTGQLATDASDAGGTGLRDRATGEWDAGLIELSRLPWAALPPVLAADALAGHVTARAAAETGLRGGTPVAVGGSDVTCTRLGAGALGEDEALIYLGTAAWMSMRDGGEGVRFIGSTTATGSALRWARDLLYETRRADGSDYGALGALAADVPPGADGLLFLPHLMGERGPADEPLARGALVGMTLAHGRGHVARAVMEGTAFQLRRVLEERSNGGAEPRRALVCGGAARSAVWLQAMADVTRLPLRVAPQVECAAWGAARLAASAAGLEPCQPTIGPEHTVMPDGRTARRYDALYARYRALQDALRPWFHAADTEE